VGEQQVCAATPRVRQWPLRWDWNSSSPRSHGQAPPGPCSRLSGQRRRGREDPRPLLVCTAQTLTMPWGSRMNFLAAPLSKSW
jgi:hypothetical protein